MHRFEYLLKNMQARLLDSTRLGLVERLCVTPHLQGPITPHLRLQLLCFSLSFVCYCLPAVGKLSRR